MRMAAKRPGVDLKIKIAGFSESRVGNVEFTLHQAGQESTDVTNYWRIGVPKMAARYFLALDFCTTILTPY